MGRVVLDQAEKQSERKTMVTVECKDGSKRVITCLGIYTSTSAIALGKDLEADNYKSVSVKVL